jgi:hypothetical protein
MLAISYFGLFRKAKFLYKKQLNDGNHGQDTPIAKMGDASLAKNIPNTPKFIHSIYATGPKVWKIVEKKASLGVRSPLNEQCVKMS